MGALMGAFHAAGNVSTGFSPEIFLTLAHALSQHSCISGRSTPQSFPPV